MKVGAKLIGVAGVARAGKDTFAFLSRGSETFKGKRIRTVAFADALKRNAGTFLHRFCHIRDISSLTGDAKTDIRPFLVWYGCYMRKIDPTYWVSQVNDVIMEDSEHDIFIVTDVRFANEAEWIHSLGGKVVHVKRYQPAPYETSLVPPANAEEEFNDPQVDKLADIHVRWPTVNDVNLRNLMGYVEEALSRQ